MGLSRKYGWMTTFSIPKQMLDERVRAVFQEEHLCLSITPGRNYGRLQPCALQKVQGKRTNISEQADSWAGMVTRETMLDKRSSVIEALTQIKMDGVPPFPSTAPQPSRSETLENRSVFSHQRSNATVPGFSAKKKNNWKRKEFWDFQTSAKQDGQNSLLFRRKYSTGTTEKQWS